MPLNRDDYPTLTDEQWDALVAAHEAELDRARTQASETARKNARRGYLSETDVQSRIDAALAEERERAEMDAAQLLEADRKAFEQTRAAFAAEQRTFKARQKLTEAGLPAEKVDSLLPLFASVDDKALDTTLDGFITTHQETVKAQVDAERVALLGGAKPPPGSTDAPSDLNTAAQQQIDAGNDAMAVEMLFQAAGYTPQQ